MPGSHIPGSNRHPCAGAGAISKKCQDGPSPARPVSGRHPDHGIAGAALRLSSFAAGDGPWRLFCGRATRLCDRLIVRPAVFRDFGTSFFSTVPLDPFLNCALVGAGIAGECFRSAGLEP